MRTSIIIAAVLAAASSQAVGGEFKRRDVTVVAQTERADLVALGTVARVERQADVDVAVVVLSEVIKGDAQERVVVRSRQNTSLSVSLEPGLEALFFLKSRQGILTPLRGQRSVQALSGPGASAAALARASAERRRSTRSSPLRLKRALLNAVVTQRGWTATDAALDLLELSEVETLGFTAAEEATLISVLEEDREKLEDAGPLISLVGSFRDVAAHHAILQPVFDPGRFPYAREIARALYERSAGTQALLTNARSHSSSEVRRNAVRVLGELASADHTEVLAAIAAEDTDVRGRSEALLALGRVQSPTSRLLLEGALVDPKRQLIERKAAALGLVWQRAASSLNAISDPWLLPFIDVLRRSPSLAKQEIAKEIR
jgi:hypothetical protein